MDNAILADFKAFSGINNIDPDFRIPVKREDPLSSDKVLDMREIENLDITNTSSLKLRPGSIKKVSGVDMHSGWSNGAECFFVDESALYLLNPDYSITSLLTNLIPGTRMVYQEFNDRIYMTNGSYIGYYKNLEMLSISDPGINFKVPLPAGQRIGLFQNKLMVASKNVLYVSDSLSDHYDIRLGFMTFASDIVMVRPVDKGVFVSDSSTWFFDENFKREKVDENSVIPHTDCEVFGSEIGDGIDGKCAMWVSTAGICVGNNNGKVKCLTSERYKLPNYVLGNSFLRSVDGVTHFITTLT